VLAAFELPAANAATGIAASTTASAIALIDFFMWIILLSQRIKFYQ
jgi:hypothetical protein